jgi:NADH-quinone oxidoreductase subunit J
MTGPFFIVALMTLAGAAGAMTLRHPVHCALSLVIAFAGLAAVYLQLGAEFVAFAQVLVYIGAVAILIVFAILLTRSGEAPTPAPAAGSAWWGVGIAAAVFLTLAGAITSSSVAGRATPPEPSAPVRVIGDRLMMDYILPLEVIALLLTAALIGAVVIAMQERKPNA